MVAYSPPPEPETPDLVDAYSCLGSALAPATEHASPLSGCTLCRHSSAIRTGCANERSSGSEEGVVRNHDPYSDLQLRTSLSHRRGVNTVIIASSTIGNTLLTPKVRNGDAR